MLKDFPSNSICLLPFLYPLLIFLIIDVQQVGASLPRIIFNSRSHFFTVWRLSWFSLQRLYLSTFLHRLAASFISDDVMQSTFFLLMNYPILIVGHELRCSENYFRSFRSGLPKENSGKLEVSKYSEENWKLEVEIMLYNWLCVSRHQSVHKPYNRVFYFKAEIILASRSRCETLWKDTKTKPENMSDSFHPHSGFQVGY